MFRLLPVHIFASTHPISPGRPCARCQNALGYDTAQERAVHSSQNEGSKGYGGKFGVSDVQDAVSACVAPFPIAGTSHS